MQISFAKRDLHIRDGDMPATLDSRRGSAAV
jgi:hypothetical protein